MFGNLGAFVHGNMFAGLVGQAIGVRLAKPCTGLRRHDAAEKGEAQSGEANGGPLAAAIPGAPAALTRIGGQIADPGKVGDAGIRHNVHSAADKVGFGEEDMKITRIHRDNIFTSSEVQLRFACRSPWVVAPSRPPLTSRDWHFPGRHLLRRSAPPQRLAFAA
jgi:hypothetical protein